MRETVRVVTAPGSEHQPRVKAVIGALNGIQSYFRFAWDADPALNLAVQGGHAEIVDLLKDHAQPTIGIVDEPFLDNWFSHGARGGSVISTADWEDHFAPPGLRTYIAYEIAQSIAFYVADLSEQMAVNMAHEPPQGCLFDICVDKSTIKYGMLAGSVCAACRATLSQFGAPAEALDAIEAILAMARADAIGKPMPLDPRAAFVVMRYSNNDENDNAWKHGIRPGLRDAEFDARRGDDTLSSAPLLEKISRDIARARLVVAKVDATNPNVYFELGLAMGWEKETLLISERSLVLELPSDLRSWECLTYPHGDYEELRRLVTRACLERFGRAV